LATGWPSSASLLQADRSAALRVVHRLADFFVLDNVKRSLGLHRTRGAPSAGPIAPELIKWYMALGIDMRGLRPDRELRTRHRHAAGSDQLGTWGQVDPDTEVALSPAGEILLKRALHVPRLLQERGRARPRRWSTAGCAPATLVRSAPTFIRITDRMKDIIITAGGRTSRPSEIENQLVPPYITDAVVIGDQHQFLSCLIMLDPDTVAQFAQERNAVHELRLAVPGPEIQDLIWGEIERVNKQGGAVEGIQALPPDRADPHPRGRGADADHEAEGART
jgi:long-chain acyl-CoA synthetase